MSFITASSLYSPLAGSPATAFEAARTGHSGLSPYVFPDGAQVYASYFHDFSPRPCFTRFETLALQAMEPLLRNEDPADLLFILSTTKGNVELLTGPGMPTLYDTALKLAAAAGIKNEPVVISNACISGISAIGYAHRALHAGHCRRALVCGADAFTHFISSGFKSLYALSSHPCKPFDKNRDGINLGEGAAAVLMEKEGPAGCTQVLGYGCTNDANHISGPSRTGRELAQAMKIALEAAGISAAEVGYVSGHGTATVFNDEMESKALAQAGLQAVPANSLKGYFGHTLGAAGVLETVMGIESMQKNTVLPTPGFEACGTENCIAVSATRQKPLGPYWLKSGSGFGGCNAALVLKTPWMHVG